MKRFEKNDIFVNRVKTYPKVSFFVNSGSLDSIWYNKQHNHGSVKLNNFLSAPPLALVSIPIDTTYFMISENSIELVTENDVNITTEQQP